MSRVTMLFSLVFLVVVASSQTTASGAPSASGRGVFGLPSDLIEFAFHVVQRPNGTAVGDLQVRNVRAGLPDTLWRAELDCLTVNGNRASMSGVVVFHNLAPDNVGFGALLTVEDNGEGANAPPDIASSFLLFEPLGYLDCQTFRSPIFELLGGNIQVHN